MSCIMKHSIPILTILSQFSYAVLSLKCEKKLHSHINLCGLCVDGLANKEDTVGTDDCGICFGSNDCLPCAWHTDECQKCLEPSRNCTLHPSVFPSKIDLASSQLNVNLILKELSHQYNSSDDVTCQIKNQEVENDLPSEVNSSSSTQGIHVTLDKSSLVVGTYLVKCIHYSSEGERNVHASMTVADSRSIRVESLTPKKVPLNSLFQVHLNVSSLSNDEDGILCFLLVRNIVYMIVKAKVVNHGQLLCNPMIITKSSYSIFIGVSESLDAIMTNPTSLNVKEIVTDFQGPVMRRSSFSSDLRQIHVHFDKNIESGRNCLEVFSEETRQSFGKGWQCWIKANKIVIQLGVEPQVQPGSRITLVADSGIQTIGGPEGRKYASVESAIIVDDVANQVVEPFYSVVAPQAVCYAGRNVGFQPSVLSRSGRRNDANRALPIDNAVTVVEVQELGGQNLVYNWSVNFNPSKSENSAIIRSQRDMLMIWLSVRLLDKSVKKSSSNRVVLNNSLMLTGIDYTISVRGANTLGMFGEEKQITLRLSDRPPVIEHRSRKNDISLSACSSGSPLDMMLLSSPATFADAECWVELSLSCCGGVLVTELFTQVDYVWSVHADHGHNVDVKYNHGKQLVIPPHTLQGGYHYNVSCVIVHKVHKTVLGSASTNLITLERGIETHINVSSVTLSTKYPLILDASRSVDLDNKPGVLEFRWSCLTITDASESFSYGDKQCYYPGKEAVLLSEKYETSFKKSLLWLPPETLSIGRYLFTVEVMKQSNVSVQRGIASVEVNVVGGSPPLISLPTKSSGSEDNFVTNPEEDVTISGFVSGLKYGCHVWWTVVDKPGCCQLNQSLLHQENFISFSQDDNSHEFPVELFHGLEGDATYCLRLSATCPSPRELGVEMSSVDFELRTDSPPTVKPLKVEPLQGQALTTLFKFSTEPAYDDLLDCPLRYSFGFRVVEPISYAVPKYFHSTSQHLSVSTYLPAFSLNSTRIQTLLRVCDARHICHTEEGPQVSTTAPSNLSLQHVEQLSDSFASLLLTEEYEDAIMVVESSLATLGILNNKSLYQISSQRIEQSINAQLELIEKKLDGSVGSVYAALRFLKVANAALKQGSFSNETLQKLVMFKDKVLSLFSNLSRQTLNPYVESRVKRQSPASPKKADQTWSILQPEMVKALLSISEVAIFNLSDSRGALNEKRKLLQNVSFFMDSLCRGLRNPTPIFIGSRAVSFSVQRLNLPVKYKDDLAVPDWRSAKSGGAPINGTAMILLGENILSLFRRDPICMGAAFYPMDFLSDVFGKFEEGSYRHSAVYQLSLIQDSKGPPRNTFSHSYDGIDVKVQSIQLKIPTWSAHVNSDQYFECRVWHHGEWSGHYCKLTKFVTLINKPAVECVCSVVGYHAVFIVDPPRNTGLTSTQSTVRSTSPPSSTAASHPLSSSPGLSFTKSQTIRTTTPQSTTVVSEGIPISNTSQNFTFKIQEDFFKTVGNQPEAFTSQLKRDIIKQVEMPDKMIMGIDVSPGSILVTLHLVDTDIRTVNDVLPTLAAVLQEGRLSVSGTDGRHLSVPPQSLQLLQRRTEHSFFPWIVTGCAAFSILCICSLVVAAIFVTRKKKHPQYSNEQPISEIKTQAPTYGRFHLEQTLDGSEATISRYRSSHSNPLVVSTIGGMASVMGTNAKIPDSYQAACLLFKLQPPQADIRSLSTTKESSHTNSNSGSGTQSSSSGNNSMSSVQRRLRSSSMHKRFSSTEDRKPILCSEERNYDTNEDDSGIVMNEGGKTTQVGCYDTSSVKQEILVLPGTPTGKGSEPGSL